MPWDAQGEAQAALATIAADPRYGATALANAQTMTNLLKDMLPDAPRESRVLVAASEVGVPGMLQAHVSQGMDVATASRLAAGSMESQTALAPEACTWAVGVLVSALRLDAAARPAAPAREAAPTGEGQPTVSAAAAEAAAAGPPAAEAMPMPMVRPAQASGLRIAAAAVAGAGAILIVWACALPYGVEGSFFSLSGGPYGSWWNAIPSVTVAVLGIAAALLFLLARTEWLRGLAAGMLVAFGMAVIVFWVSQDLLHAGSAEIVGIAGGLLLLVAGVLAVAGRKGQPAAAPGA
jgi:hypothetical protein